MKSLSKQARFDVLCCLIFAAMTAGALALLDLSGWARLGLAFCLICYAIYGLHTLGVKPKLNAAAVSVGIVIAGWVTGLLGTHRVDYLLLVVVGFQILAALDFRLGRTVNSGQTMPRFYGVAWQHLTRDAVYCLPVPLNILAGAARGIWYWLRYGWMPLPASPRAAYAQGRRDMARELGADPML